MTPKYRTLEGTNRTLKGEGAGSKMVENRWTSFMDVSLWQQTTAKNLRTRKPYNI